MLTTTQIKNIKTGILSDVGPHRGLRLNTTSAGKSWIFRYKNFEGKIKQLKLGMFPTMPLAEAREKVADYKQILGVHAAVYNLFNLGRHLVGAEHYRNLRISAFNEWRVAAA